MIFGALGVFAFIMLPILFVIGIITLIVTVAQKTDNIKGFEKTIRSIYLYFVLVACIIMLIVGTVGVIVKAMDIALPVNQTTNTNTSTYQETLQHNEKVGNTKELVTFCAVLGIGLGGTIFHGAKIKSLKKED